MASTMFNSLSLDTAHVADTFQQYPFDSSAVVDEQDRAKMVDGVTKLRKSVNLTANVLPW